MHLSFYSITSNNNKKLKNTSSQESQYTVTVSIRKKAVTSVMPLGEGDQGPPS